MKTALYLLLLAGYFLIALMLPCTHSYAEEEELIAPTQTLDEESDGRLTVLSEPPGQKVQVNGAKLGNTPIWSKELEPGTYELKVDRSETKVTVESGKTLRVSLFKGTFITIPEEEPEIEAALPPPPPQEEVPKAPERPRKLPKKELNTWDLFINGTHRHF